MYALILVCIFGTQTQTTHTINLSAAQTSKYQALERANVIDSEESYTEFERDYLVGLCAKQYHRQPTLTYLTKTNSGL